MRSIRLIAAALACAIAAAVTLTPADAAAGDGTITVTIVDEHGDPMPGAVVVATAAGFFESRQAVSTLTLTVPPGAYAVLALTPWGGMQCVGLAECDYYSVASGTITPDGKLVVAAGQATSVSITGTKPVSLSGSGQVGTPLTLRFSDGMQALLGYLGGAGGGFLTPTVTWLRDGTPIAGENDYVYRPHGKDVGTSVSARIEYLGSALGQFQQLTGAPVTPRTTNAIRVAKVPTKAFAILSNPAVKAGNRGKVRVEVTAKNVIVTGKVVVSVEDWSQTRALRNGTARVMLPALAAGKHQVDVRYLGSSVYEPSKADPRTLTVTK